MAILVTGAAGFIGMHVVDRLLHEGYPVIGADVLNDYYDVSLKEARLSKLLRHENFTFYKTDLSEEEQTKKLFSQYDFEQVIHLAAQAGVRYSLQNPHSYIQSNIVAFMNILEACRYHPVSHLIYASSSSVYGANEKRPYSTSDHVDHPISLYAATKKANELMAHTYSHLYKIPTTGLRFFTVYGPYGRPDMAYFSFTKKLFERKPIQVFNYGKMERDFTYIDDIVEGIHKLIWLPPKEGSEQKQGQASSLYKLYNIGNNKPVSLMDFIYTLEKYTGEQAIIEYLPIQPGDVKATYADIDDLTKATGFKPITSIEEGLKKFVQWYKEYYNK